MLKYSNWVGILVVTIAAAACGPGAPSGTGESKLQVVATTTIVGDLVQTIGGDGVEVEALMGPGIDPHLYKASAGDVRRMSSARAIFYSGLHLEGKMTDVLAGMNERGIRTVAVAECIPEGRLIALEGFAGLHDPHVWFDVDLWAATVDCVALALTELNPEDAAVYNANAAAYLDKLGELDAWVRERAADLPSDQRVLVTAHDAFAYFGRAYGFEVRGLLGVSTASETGTSDVQRLAEFIVERRIPAVYVETSVPPRYVEALQEAVASRGFEVRIGGSLFSDSLGNSGTPESTYEGTVRANVNTIIGGLEKSDHED
jgi:manganese/zinc/iron transport system substrate-binding protein